MKKRDVKKKENNISKIIIILVIVLIIVVLLFIAFKFTGNVVNSEKFICSDTDGGKNYELNGTISQGGVIKGIDSCTSNTRLKEYYCMTRTSTNHYYYNCPYKCSKGQCINE